LDPGNWATDMEGGSSYGYRLLFIILISNIIAVFLQNLTIRLGTIASLDLASASRRYFPRWLNLFLYVLAEIAIIATDIAEVIGSAIALNLLFPKLPLPAGVAITAVDVFIILLFYTEEADDPDSPQTDSASLRMVRFFEMFVMMLVAAVGICFIIELAYSDIVAVDVLKGFLPTKEIFTQPDILYVAIGIIGATGKNFFFSMNFFFLIDHPLLKLFHQSCHTTYIFIVSLFKRVVVNGAHKDLKS
jgi:NRAMP (natural resistance-associated macrophage protein)-like metal ion transporter